MIIQFKEVEITPKLAAEWLEELNEGIEAGTHQQRAPSRAAVSRMAADIKRKNFALTHQAIAFNQSGALIDGRQRLMAIVEANTSCKMVVARNVPDSHKSSGGRMATLDLVDSGRNRTLGQVWAGIHSMHHGHLLASLVRNLAEMASGAVSVTKAQGMELKTLFEDEIAMVIEATSQGVVERRSWVLAPMIIAAVVDKKATQEFATLYCLMANIPTGHPVLALRRWVENKSGHSGGSRNAGTRAVCNAIHAYFEPQSLKELTSDKSGQEWLMTEAKLYINKIKQIVGAETKDKKG